MYICIFFIVACSITGVILHALRPYDTYIVVVTYTLFKISYTNYYILLG